LQNLKDGPKELRIDLGRLDSLTHRVGGQRYSTMYSPRVLDSNDLVEVGEEIALPDRDREGFEEIASSFDGKQRGGTVECHLLSSTGVFPVVLGGIRGLFPVWCCWFSVLASL